jgi:hypothetical protein
MMAEWLAHPTGTHQDHVIAHVIGATVLGYFVHEEAAHLLLDIGFFWTILLDGEMGLVTQSLAVSELEIDERERGLIREDVARLHAGESEEARPLSFMTRAPLEYLIEEVSFYARDEQRRVLVACQAGAPLLIETSLVTREIRIGPEAGEMA